MKPFLNLIRSSFVVVVTAAALISIPGFLSSIKTAEAACSLNIDGKVYTKDNFKNDIE